MAMVWRDKHDVYVLTNMHTPPAKESNLCEKHGNALKPQIVQDYNQHLGYIDKGGPTVSQSNGRHGIGQKLFFTLVRHG
jgi:hypothetical protein